MHTPQDLASEFENLGRAISCVELAEKLNVNRATVWRWAVSGALQYFRVGPHTIRFDCREVAIFLRGKSR